MANLGLEAAMVLETFPQDSGVRTLLGLSTLGRGQVSSHPAISVDAGRGAKIFNFFAAKWLDFNR